MTVTSVKDADERSTTSALGKVLDLVVKGFRQGTIGSGARAELRRGTLGTAFWRIALDYLEPAGALPDPGAPWRTEAEDRWCEVLSGLARTYSLHRAGRRLGTALANAGLSEARLMRLLRATASELGSEVRSVVHRLASVGEPFDWSQLARLTLYSESDSTEALRRAIARDYYRPQASAGSRMPRPARTGR
jgi:CRISPR type I-E-associated protein CasB/Cse2